MEPETQRSGIREGIVAYARRGLKLYVILFIIEVAIIFVVVTLPFFPGEKALYTGQGNQITNEFAGAGLFTLIWGIFTNNLRIALLEMIPGFGAALFGFSIYSTARILEVYALNANAPPLAVAFTLLLFFPHSYIELPAYAFATGEGLYLLYAVWKWALSKGDKSPNLSAEGWQFVINLIIVVVMLAVAATFESVEIVLGSPLLWLTWIPFVGLIALGIYLDRKLNRLKNEKRAELPPAGRPDDSSNVPL